MAATLLRKPLPRPVVQRRRIENIATNIPWWGSADANVVIVVDPMVDAGGRSAQPLNGRQLEFLVPYLKSAGLSKPDICIIAASPPCDDETWSSDKRLGDFLKSHRDEFVECIRSIKPKLILAMGKAAARQVTGRAVQITKMRGVPYYDDAHMCVVLPMLGIKHVMTRPELEDTYRTDVDTAGRIIANGYDASYEESIPTDYRWCTDLSDLIKNPPPEICLDIESTGGEWFHDGYKVLTVQMTWEEGKGIIVPLDYDHTYTGPRDPAKMWTRPANLFMQVRIVNQLKQLLMNPKIKFFGHNFKSDWIGLHARLKVRVANYSDDTLLLVHHVDEDMLNKSLDECVRRWVPAMSGYADVFNKDPVHKHKSRMDLVSPDKMIGYGCGDSDACFRLRNVVRKLLAKEPANLNCYNRVSMPAMRAFCEIEQVGFTIDVEALRRFEEKLRKHQAIEFARLWSMVPADIREKHAKSKGKGSPLLRPGLLRDMLFTHPSGLKLKPLVFTKGTRKAKNDEDKIPSISTKEHLPYFEGIEFVDGIKDFVKNEKMLGTYVGDEDDDTGFYKYLHNGLIRPTYLLHGTKTGRSASRRPNGQNFPKRGMFAYDYRSVFVAPPGHVLIECDFSQLELRVAAAMAGEENMMNVFRSGGDIHTATACAVMGITLAEFEKLDAKTKKLKRFEAKAVNFGFLYGMGWRKFKQYAKTEYKVDFTDDEAQDIRKAFFRAYPKLEAWHRAVREFVRENGYVRAYDGRTRHLPSVNSPDDAIAQSAERQAINSPVQGFGSDLGLMALARITQQAPAELLRIAGFVHDAIIAVAPEEKAIEACREIKRFMESNPLKEWFNFVSPVPIIAEASVGYSLADMIELEKERATRILEDKNVVSFAQAKAIHDEINARDKAAKDAAAKPAEPAKPAPKAIKRLPRKLHRAA